MQFPSKIIPGFLSDLEIQHINELSVEFLEHRDIGESGHNVTTRPFFMQWENYQGMADILMPKIRTHFGNSLQVDAAHILESYRPYGIHNDIASAGFDPLANNDRQPAWTFIIPLDDYDSRTVVFNESDPVHKITSTWIRERGIHPHGLPVDEEFYQRYLTNTPRADYDYLTIKDVFEWKRGSMFAAARANFHTSDNFPSWGVESKRAIIMWTTVPA
jgi:hypothetical protein